MRIAVIDCGTNTFNLLVVDLMLSDYSIIHSSKIAVKIGKGGINNSLILPDAMDRAMQALKSHRNEIDRLSAEKILVFATSAVRSAGNKEEFISRAMEEAGLEVTVISGEREAELIYEGVKNSGTLTDEICLLMDIGGGSCEFILCNREKIVKRYSYEIGVSRLIDKFTPEDPILPSTVEAMYAYLNDILKDMFRQTEKDAPQYLVGSSGTFDTFRDILLARNPDVQASTTEFTYTTDEFEHLYKEILGKTYEERLQIPGMAKFRAEMITASVIAVKCITDQYHFKHIKSSAYSLKEGIMFALRNGTL